MSGALNLHLAVLLLIGIMCHESVGVMDNPLGYKYSLKYACANATKLHLSPGSLGFCE